MNLIIKIFILTIGAFTLTYQAKQNQIYIELRDGHFMPILGLGTWQSQNSSVYQAVIDAIGAGYRHIDTAYAYGNEKEIGKAIKDLISAKKIKREDVFIVTKVWNTFHTRQKAYENIKISLSNLGLDYVDLVLIHWPFAFKEGNTTWPYDKNGKVILTDVDYLDTWKGMEDAHAAKKVRSLGLSNFNSVQITRVIENSKVKPVVNQVENHPLLTQRKLIEFCQNNSIAVTAWSPLGHGNLLKDAKIASIGKKYNKTAAQIMIRYQIDRSVIVIPKSTTKSRIIENFQVFDFSLAPEDMKTLNSMNKDNRSYSMPDAKNHKYYPFNIPY